MQRLKELANSGASERDVAKHHLAHVMDAVLVYSSNNSKLWDSGFNGTSYSMYVTSFWPVAN